MTARQYEELAVAVASVSYGILALWRPATTLRRAPFRSSPPTEDTGRKVLGVGRLRACLYWRVEDGTRRVLYAASLTLT